MTLKIYGSPYSTCNSRVLIVCAEKGIPYEQIILDFTKGEHKQPDYVKLMPFGKVPTIDDDGFVLYESRAIARYLALKYADQGTKLMPDTSDLQAYALFERACSLEQSYFDGPVSGIAFEKVFKGLKGLGAPDEAIIAKHVAALHQVFSVYDSILANQPYLAGDLITLGDLNHLPYGKMIRDLGHKDVFEKYPNVTRWWDSMEERESWKKLVG